MKSGGYLVFCGIEGQDRKSEMFFADLDLNLRKNFVKHLLMLGNISKCFTDTLNDKVGMEAVVKLSHVKENSEGYYETTCKWSPFFLAENVLWYLIQKDGTENLLTKNILTESIYIYIILLYSLKF
jgi:hypothetical protein